MDSEIPKPSPTPEFALRPRPQVLMEAWGTTDDMQISRLVSQRWQAAPPPIDTYAKLKLPYQAPSCPPLPSPQQILDATTKNPLHRQNFKRPVCKIGNTVIKYSDSAHIVEEAENLLFLGETRPQLRIPKVLAVWEIHEGLGADRSVVYCLMMNFIDGLQLNGELLAGLPEHAQDIICAKVSAQIAYLRSLPSETYYGRAHGQGWLIPPSAVSVVTAAPMSVSGPYHTYQEFVSVMHRAYESKLATTFNGTEWPPSLPAQTAEFLSIFSDWKPNEPKYTWIEPHCGNIIARLIKDNAGNEDWEVSLIDWECAGWYPAWVQALQFNTHCGTWTWDRSKEKFPVKYHRRDEIVQRMVKDFEPNLDLERFAKILEAKYWDFF